MVFNWLFGKKKTEPAKEKAYNIDFHHSERPPERKWKFWGSNLNKLPVAGIAHRLDEVQWFISGALTAEDTGQGSYGILLEREPTNPHDKNAIQVWGWLNEPGNKKQIGYLKAKDAKNIANKFPPGTPLSAELSRLFMPESRIPWIGLLLLIPAKSDPFWKQFET